MSLAPFDNESFWNGMYLWNKGIRFSLLGDLRFDETMPISEDITFIWQLFLKAKKYALAPHSFYIYRQRSSSVIHLAHKLHTWFSCDIKMIDGFLDGPYPEDFKQVLRIKLFELYYFHLTQSIHAGLKNDGKYFFDRLSRHWSLYKQLCPAKHSKKIRRVIFGWRFNYHYLRFRKKQSEKRKLRVGKKPLPLFP